MAFFKRKGPKLPSYIDISLEGLRADPTWTEAIKNAGWSIDHCELVWHVESAMVSTGYDSELSTARPALVLGHGDRLAIVYPAEREIQVVTRPNRKAQLQTNRWDKFMIRFGPESQMDVWVLSELQAGTPDGDRFGRTVLQFLAGRPSKERPNSPPTDEVGRGSPAGSFTSQPLPHITPELVAEARDFMAEWTRIVGQAGDPVFWSALARFGRIGGAVQRPHAHGVDSKDIKAVFERPWRTWIEITKKANEIRDYELAVCVFLFAYVMVDQVAFDVEVSAACGFERPSEESYREIARHALAAANLAPDDFSVVERSTEPPVAKRALQLGLGQLLGVDPTDAEAVDPVEVSPLSASVDAGSDSPRTEAVADADGAGADRETLHGLLHQLAGACAEVMRLHAACDEMAERIQKGRHVIDMPQAPASRETFRGVLARYEAELSSLLEELRAKSEVGQTLWRRTMMVSGALDPSAGDQGMARLLMDGVDDAVLEGEELSSIMVGGLFLKADFGTTVDSFYETDRWLAQLMSSQLDG